MIYYAITVSYLILYCIILSYLMLYYCAREEAQGGRGSPPLPLPSLPRHNNPTISVIIFVFLVFFFRVVILASRFRVFCPRQTITITIYIIVTIMYLYDIAYYDILWYYTLHNTTYNDNHDKDNNHTTNTHILLLLLIMIMIIIMIFMILMIIAEARWSQKLTPEKEDSPEALASIDIITITIIIANHCYC